MPKKLGHHKRKRRAKRRSHAKASKRRRHTAAASHLARLRKARLRGQGGQRKRKAQGAHLGRNVTEQTLRDHMALNCVRRCMHRA